jgi:hypothetical protein
MSPCSRWRIPGRHSEVYFIIFFLVHLPLPPSPIVFLSSSRPSDPSITTAILHHSLQLDLALTTSHCLIDQLDATDCHIKKHQKREDDERRISFCKKGYVGLR